MATSVSLGRGVVSLVEIRKISLCDWHRSFTINDKLFFSLRNYILAMFTVKAGQ